MKSSEKVVGEKCDVSPQKITFLRECEKPTKKKNL